LGFLAVARSLSGYSGTGYVSRFENSADKLTLSAEITAEGSYDIYVGYCAEYGTKPSMGR